MKKINFNDLKKLLPFIIICFVIGILGFVTGLSVGKFLGGEAEASTENSEAEKDKITFNYGQDNPITVDIIDTVPLNTLQKNKFYVKDNFKYYDNSKVIIDVSSHQNEINWEAVKNSGVDGVMIRAGYRGYTEGQLYEDSYFKYNIEKAIENGLDVGVYFFSQAINKAEAVEEARYVYNLIKDYDITLPVAYDWELINEANVRTLNVDSAALSENARAFCDEIKRNNYQPMIYFNQYLGYCYYDLSKFSDCKFWYVEYGDFPEFTYNVDIWQYTESAYIDGIEGTVDVNVLF